MKNIKTHIFDLDGTIADSMGAWADAMLRVLNDSGVKYPENVIEIITPLGSVATAKYFAELGVGGTFEETVDRIYSYLLPKYRDTIPAKEGVCEYIKGLKENGCRLFVLTASPHILVDPCLRRLGIYDLFDRVYTTDDMQMTKSNKEIYYKLCRDNGADISDAAFYDDNVIAVRTAAETELYTVGVYDKTSDNSRADIEKAADRYICSFNELI